MTRWEDFYREDPRVLSAPPTDCALYAADLFARHRARRILDLGCGVGRDSFYLSDRRFDAIASDLAASGLEIALRLTSARNSPVPFIQADARRLPFVDACFDGVYCFGLLHEFISDSRESDVKAVTGEIRRVLRPGGALVLAVLAGNPSDGLPHVCLFTEAMFDSAVAAFGTLEKSRCRDVGCTGSPNYQVWRGSFVKRP